MENIIDNKSVLDLLDSLKQLYKVDCVVLGGSRSTGQSDDNSDFDLYVYYTQEPDEQERRFAVAPHCAVAEIGNHYWESEDNVILKNGTKTDIIYRPVDKFAKMLDLQINQGFALNGYTTCFWHNIKHGKALFDKSGTFTNLQKKFDVDYPEKLRKNIITNNRKLLSGFLPSYDKQIKLAWERGDVLSVHHRITEYLASYFDIIFALNRQTHPGEKRQIELAKKYCEILPEDFEENIIKLLGSVVNGNPYKIVCDMLEKLDRAMEGHI